MWIVLTDYVRWPNVVQMNHIGYTVPETDNYHGGTCRIHLRLLYGTT